jgi:hypothetical protein
MARLLKAPRPPRKNLVVALGTSFLTAYLFTAER